MALGVELSLRPIESVDVAGVAAEEDDAVEAVTGGSSQFDQHRDQAVCPDRQCAGEALVLTGRSVGQGGGHDDGFVDCGRECFRPALGDHRVGRYRKMWAVLFSRSQRDDQYSAHVLEVR